MPLPAAYQNIPRFIAHRGASAQAPENTHASMRLAIELGAKWAETDITISADGIAVIHHDAELERCSNGTGLVIQKTLAQLKKLDVGGWYGPEFAGEKFLTLTELLSLANQHGLGLNLEIKPTMGREAETVAAIKCAFAEVPPRTPILFSSFNPYALKEAQQQLPSYTRALCSEALPQDWQVRLNEIGASGLHFARDFFDAKAIAAIKAAGFYCLSYTVNDPAEAERFFNAGVDAVFHDMKPQN